jgi:hypothetical protein
MLLDRLAPFKPSWMPERWREREFPNDVIGDQRLPFARLRRVSIWRCKRSEATVIGGLPCRETTPVASLPTSWSAQYSRSVPTPNNKPASFSSRVTRHHRSQGPVEQYTRAVPDQRDRDEA